MKKLVNATFVYTILALLSGVFYREFTRFNDFTGKTVLSLVHVHIMALGVLFLLIVLILNKLYNLTENKNYKKFYAFYNAGLGIMIIVFIIKGILQVKMIEITNGIFYGISFFSAIAHILILVGLIYFFVVLKKQVSLEKK